ncbi:MAG TPA: conjugal transfer protein TraC [Candidatus Wildermuthbacteria bacterium]|uniref:Type IV secretory pathway VirB4 protein-like protein n=1 Tax=Candidatus Yanofskybacteria bacterium GW2011_GWC1_48_11 TaxID=1619027 RepID=A0A837IPI0_9BACT|nr:MAG: Type IV secretory pathway VirB4 protein-like protein [Candidatus Yanofskybacteria bacterium GW2011_GWC1_48_11]KKW03933.1 MAG: Type IV secretory pathway VirB4 protein-like protein [Parcubacteria group bacterium GW2011_GWB1_49_12]KKW08720.1 MAG: Type IV secretory pathway VirB4 protein-like protein [Parcubacteria group bacterium GW2011_GWA1_49_26]KKW13980.1 MAG: Type IV secretory pathway VirB4 protein-like protein [Parcubacteria group bacterium GW2011_GWA2_50_10]HCM36636.1 conjugal transfe
MKLPFLKSKGEEEIPTREQIFETRPVTEKDIIAPSSIRVNQDGIQLGNRLVKSFFIFSYPRYLHTAWLSSAINLDIPMDISLFMHPIDTGYILKKLRRRVTEVQSEIMEEESKGLVRNPELETAFQDMEALRDRLQTAQERMFRFALYITVYAQTVEELREIQTTLRSIFESRLMYVKPALYQQKEGFHSCLPYGMDLLQVHNSMNTEPLSSVFPFVSFDLSSSEGIMYGINRHNNSLILFDRFSLENANSTIFATSGSGKSYAVKLEILRYLMWGVDVIVLDPENEYKTLAEQAGGSFFDISLGSEHHINPFDLSEPREEERPEDVLRSNVINLVGLMRIALGGLTPEEDAIMDRAISETYSAKDITPTSNPALWKDKIPLMEDLEQVLRTMEGADSLVKRLQKLTTGTYANFFNKPSNISLQKNIVSFGIREMEDSLRPMAIYIIMRHIWNTVRSELKKRIFVLDEAWWLMQTEDGASFLFGMVKRARKYWLGVTTITQDVDDFMRSEYGRPIITNSSLQLLMKQSPASIETVQKAFALTSEEKTLLLETSVGEGIFFAGQKHVAIKVVASPAEHEMITTAPEELARRKAREVLEGEPRFGVRKTDESEQNPYNQADNL